MGAASRPGAVVLFGSGETAAVGSEALRWLRATGRAPRCIAILETPAGFEPNAGDVAGRWTDFLRRQPETLGAELVQLAARRRGTRLSPDEPEISRPLLRADLVVLGAGSPTYAVRQLKGSLAWRYGQAAHLMGASFFLASAAAIAAGTRALPVYEIYKVGEELHWKDGLGLLEQYGLTLAVVTHWDNADGGATLDTSRCYMGQARFADLLALLPAHVVVLGIAEHTAVALDLATATAHVLGRGQVIVLRDGASVTFVGDASFPLAALGPFSLPRVQATVPAETAQAIRAARSDREATAPPADVATLLISREQARAARDWTTADRLRREILERGWRIEDTPTGPHLHPLGRTSKAEPTRR